MSTNLNPISLYLEGDEKRSVYILINDLSQKLIPKYFKKETLSAKIPLGITLTRKIQLHLIKEFQENWSIYFETFENSDRKETIATFTAKITNDQKKLYLS